MKVTRILAPTAAAAVMLMVAAAGNTMAAQVTDTTKQVTDSTKMMPPPSVDVSTETGVVLTDSAVIAMLQIANTQQVAAADLAIQNAENEQVRAFARDLKAGHQASQTQLESIAARLGGGNQIDRGMAAGIPADSVKADSAYQDPTQQKKAERTDKPAPGDVSFLASLEALEGHEFDHGFVRLEIDNHEKTIQKLQTEIIPGVEDAELKSTLTAMVPELQAHLQTAVELEKTLGQTPGGEAAPDSDMN